MKNKLAMKQWAFDFRKATIEYRTNIELGKMELKNNNTKQIVWRFPDEYEKEEEDLQKERMEINGKKKYEVIEQSRNPNSPEIRQRIEKQNELKDKEIQEKKEKEDLVEKMQKKCEIEKQKDLEIKESFNFMKIKQATKDMEEQKRKSFHPRALLHPWDYQ